tara:strand:- start:718 stop:867 length:150 start_codon:yes stop_codon:yes gene_type:complete
MKHNGKDKALVRKLGPLAAHKDKLLARVDEATSLDELKVVITKIVELLS